MRVGFRVYVAGALVLVGLVGCGRWFAEREPWRREAEVACLKSGAVKPGVAIEQLRPIDGPGMCGADFPLKVAALGQSSVLGFAQDLRPPGSIPQSSALPRQLQAPPSYGAQTYQQPYPQQAYPQEPYPQQAYPQQSYPQQHPQPQYPQRASGQGSYYGAAPPGAPTSLNPPGVDPDGEDVEEFDDGEDDGPPGSAADNPSYPYPPASQRGAPRYNNPAGNASRDPYGVDGRNHPDYITPRGQPRYVPPASAAQPGLSSQPLPSLGPNRDGMSVASAAVVEPAATLACPLVSALDQWMAGSVQPAAQRWFGQPVASIKQISAYSCRGMNGQRGARISEHAFGNALDIAAFTLADGRRVTVKDGWRGAPEEQGFLRDVHAAACEQFMTVLAPGSNAFHYDHIHVDLMRRGSGRRVCNPEAIPGDAVAARAARRNPLAQRFNRDITGSVGPGRMTSSGAMSFAPEPQDEAEDKILPSAVPGED